MISIVLYEIRKKIFKLELGNLCMLTLVEDKSRKITEYK